MTETIIITAGGKGLRMGKKIPKQFLLIRNKPILFYTMEQFYNYNDLIEIILVLPAHHIQYWESLIQDLNFRIPHIVVEGGSTRYHSIKNGLEKANGDLIGVHDGVRPFVSTGVISTVFESAKRNGASIPVLPLTESIREVVGEFSTAKDRSLYRSVQTPQCFRSNILKSAYQEPYQSVFTDDASVVEANNVAVTLVNGNEENIKITTPFDFKIAELFLK